MAQVQKTITCETCKQIKILEKTRNYRVVKYCSKSCFHVGRKGKTMKNKGRPLSLEHRAKLSGKLANNWQGGITSENERLRKTVDYALWRTAVFVRDNYSCQECNQKGGELQADHIKPFALYPELRFAIDNGRTLCVTCHRQTDTFGGRIMNYGTDK